MQAAMEQSKEEFVPFSVALEALHKRCNGAGTGTMYLITDKEHGAIISLANGRIADIFYRGVRGVKALPLICEIATTKYFCKNNPDVTKDIPNDNAPLPGNDKILEYLRRGVATGGVIGGAAQAEDTVKKILVVEDSALARKALVNVLAGKGYTTVEASDGFEALGKLSEHKVDLVLLDLILPKMDGYAVLSAMKKDNTYKEIPVIVLTSRDALFDKLKGKMSGTDEYLTKPIKPDEVINKVKKYLD